jgi:hypothetical protein
VICRIDEVIEACERLLLDAHELEPDEAVVEFKRRHSLLVMYQNIKECGFTVVSVTEANIKDLQV